jgi:hypothetical protein
LDLTRQQKEISSWSILVAGLFGGVARMILVLLSALSYWGVYASLGETVFISLGTIVFLRGQMRGKAYFNRDTHEDELKMHKLGIS